MKTEKMLLQRKTRRNQLLNSPAFARQHGVALIVSMILLVVITVLSVSAMRGTNLDAKIAANYQHKQLSFQAAENAFAKLTSGAQNVIIPTAATGTLRSTDYVVFSGVAGQPDNSADLDLTFIEEKRTG